MYKWKLKITKSKLIKQKNEEKNKTSDTMQNTEQKDWKNKGEKGM